jgi:regulator of G-protein signaling
MTTESADKTGTPKKQSQLGNHSGSAHADFAPNILVYKKMESIIEKMQSENNGVTVKTVKAFMSKVPSGKNHINC